MKSGVIYILGAGASRFAGYPCSNTLLPFLRYELNQKIDIQTKRLGQLWMKVADRVITTIENASNSATLPDVEAICTLIDLALMDTGIANLFGISAYDLTEAQPGLSRLVTSAFTYHTYCVRSQVFRGIHQELLLDNAYLESVIAAWAERIAAGDVVVTFNWDPLHEMVLLQAGKWNYWNGYGFPIIDTQKPDSPAKVLKLHGSCNWSLHHPTAPEPSLDYIHEIFDENYHSVDVETLSRLEPSADHGYSLIQPSYLKDPSAKPALLPIWSQAADAITTAKKISVLGYSLPLADGPTRTLFSLALSRNQSLNELEIVLGDKPEDPGYRRWRDFCSSVGKIARQIYKTFEEFVLAK